MFLHTDRKLLQTHLSVLVLHVLLTHFCTGQPQLIGSSQPVVATVGEDVILPCYLKPAADVSDLTLEWTRPDLNPRFVLVWRTGQELEDKKHKSFVGRTSLFVSELNVGNISLKLSRVKLSDEGTYRCFVPGLRIESSVRLVVGSNVVSSPLVTVAGIDKAASGVILHCGSKGWYPEPEVSWLDSEGHVLSVGPTETVRGPDGLYTVSSRVTVEKRHRNIFTCRVQQKDINQIRETQIHVPDDFFELQSSSSAVIVGLTVSLSVCILIILLLVFLVWRQNRIKNKRRGGTEKFVSEEDGERETLRTDRTGQMKVLNKRKREKENKHQLQDRVKELEEELETKKKEVEDKQAELQQLHEEKKRNQEEELWNPKKQLENKNTELKRTGTNSVTSPYYKMVTSVMSNQKKDEETAKIHQQDLVSRIKELENKAAEMNTQWRQTNEELKETRLQLKKKDEENMKLKRELDQQIWDQKKREEKELNETDNLLMEERKKREEAERQVENLKKELENKGASLRSTTGPVVEVEVDQKGKYVRLRNTSKENRPIGGWELKAQINNEEPVKHTFEKSLILSPEKTVTLWLPSFNEHCSPPDWVWRDLKRWRFGDKLQVVLISNTGEIKHLAVHSVTDKSNIAN